MFQGFSLKSVIFACLASILCITTGAGAAPACPQMEVVAIDVHGSRSIAAPDGKILHLSAKPLLSMADFTGANVTLTEGQIVLNINLDRESARRIQQFSKDHVGTTMAFIGDGRVIRTAKIVDPIVVDGFLIGPFDRAEAEALAGAINKRAADHSDAECGRAQ